EVGGHGVQVGAPVPAVGRGPGERGYPPSDRRHGLLCVLHRILGRVLAGDGPGLVRLPALKVGLPPLGFLGPVPVLHQSHSALARFPSAMALAKLVCAAARSTPAAVSAVWSRGSIASRLAPAALTSSVRSPAGLARSAADDAMTASRAAATAAR